MKYLFINTVCMSGSTGRICLEAAKRLEEKGHECKIAYGRGPVINEKFAVRIGTKVSVLLHALYSRIFDNEGLCSKLATKHFVRYIEKYNPDVIWLHNLHGHYLNIRILFKYLKKSNKKILWTLHDCWAFTGHCSHFDFVNCEKWKSGCWDCPEKRQYPKSVVFDSSKKNYVLKRELFTNIPNLTIITPSKWLANLVKESFLREYPIKVFNNKIDNNSFKPTDSDFREKYKLEQKIIILGVANVWTERKGLFDFFKLSEILDDRFKIILVGVNKKQLKVLPKKIIGIIRTKDKIELAQIYSTADIFLNLTYEDTYPTVNLEATACGTTVVTYNTGGSVESALKENIVEKGNLLAVVNRIKEICAKG